MVGASTAAVLWSAPPAVKYEPTAGDPASSPMPTPVVTPIPLTAEQPPSSAISEAADRATPPVGSVETLARVPLQRPDPETAGCPSGGCAADAPIRPPRAEEQPPLSTPAPDPTLDPTDPLPPVSEDPPPPVEPPYSDSNRSTQNFDAPEE